MRRAAVVEDLGGLGGGGFGGFGSNMGQSIRGQGRRGGDMKLLVRASHL
jgi:hypothetical protein